MLRRVVERALAAVALELHIPELHLEPVLGHDFSSLGERVLLPVARALPCGDVLHGRLADDPFDFVGILDPLGFHLGPDKLSGQGDDAHILSRVDIHHRHISGLNPPALANAEIALAVPLEADLHDVERPLAFWNGHPFEPVKYGHHIATAVAAIAIGPTA